jgi:hypothetical protein
MKNLWLKNFKETRDILASCHFGLWTGAEHIKIQPVALTVTWEFDELTRIRGVNLIGPDGSYCAIPIRGQLDIDLTFIPKDQWIMDFKDVKVNGWTLEKLL